MTRRQRPRTLEEHHAHLEETGEYDSMMELRRAKEEERQKRVAEWRQAETPLLNELRDAGLPSTPSGIW